MKSNFEQHNIMERMVHFYHINPDKICGKILDRHGKISDSIKIHEWVEESSKLAVILQSRGIKNGDRVLISLPSSRDFLESMLALWWIGAIPVPVPELSGQYKKKNYLDRIANVVRDCQPTACLVKAANQEESFVAGEEYDDIFHPHFFWNLEDISKEKESLEKFRLDLYEVKKNDIAFMQYTSGSTSKPKGVIVTHESLIANLKAMQKAAPFDANLDKLLNWMPLYHDMGLVGGVLLNAYVGSQFYLLSPLSFLGNPSLWLKIICDHGITISTGPNFAYDLCARRVRPETMQGLDLRTWRLAYNGAEPISIQTLERFTEKFSPYGFSDRAFFPVYGMAELTLAASFPIPGQLLRVDYVDRGSLTKQLASKSEKLKENGVAFVSVGKALPGHTITIQSDTGKALPERQIGEVCVRGPSVFRGYYHENLVDSKKDQEELRTGDLGYMADGDLFIVDRLKDLVILAGLNYSPTDMEQTIESFDFVRTGRSIAFSVWDQNKGTEGLILVVEVSSPVSGKTEEYPSQAEMTRTIQNKIMDKFSVATSDVVLCQPRSIPMTSSGKKQRSLCKSLYLEGAFISRKV